MAERCIIVIFNYNLMKINIKNLKGEIFSVEIDPAQTVHYLRIRSVVSNKKSRPRRG